MLAVLEIKCNRCEFMKMVRKSKSTSVDQKIKCLNQMDGGRSVPSGTVY